MVMKSIEGGSNFYYTESDTFLKRAKWKLKWHLSFCKCNETGKQLWPFTKAYHGKATWAGPGELSIEEHWLSQSAYIYLKLKGKL